MINATDTLARRLGTTTHLSGLLIKARRLGLRTPRDLCTLAVQRGCGHYSQGTEPAGELVPRGHFSDEELALSLLNIALPYDPHCIRCGAAMLGSDQNDPDQIARLAKWERSEIAVRYVAECGRRFEPENPFWQRLIDLLPLSTPKEGVLPHATRFVAMNGFVHGIGPKIETEWQRPRRAKTCA